MWRTDCHQIGSHDTPFDGKDALFFDLFFFSIRLHQIPLILKAMDVSLKQVNTSGSQKWAAMSQSVPPCLIRGADSFDEYCSRKISRVIFLTLLIVTIVFTVNALTSISDEITPVFKASVRFQNPWKVNEGERVDEEQVEKIRVLKARMLEHFPE